MSPEVEEALLPIQPGLYSHYKGGEYRVYEEATCTDTEKPVVVYRQLSTGRLFTRDKVVFLGSVTVGGPPGPTAETVRRFERVGD